MANVLLRRQSTRSFLTSLVPLQQPSQSSISEPDRLWDSVKFPPDTFDDRELELHLLGHSISEKTEGSRAAVREEGGSTLQVLPFLHALEEMQEQGELCDLELRASDSSVPVRVHRVVVSAWSEVFRSHGLITSKVINLMDVKNQELVRMVDFIYRRQIKCAAKDIPKLLQAGARYDFAALQESCAYSLAQFVTPKNSCSFLRLAEIAGHSAWVLKECAMQVILNNFSEASSSSSFLELEKELIQEVLSDDGLKPSSEQDVLDALYRWAEYDGKRAPLLPDLLHLVRFGLLDKDSLEKATKKVSEDSRTKGCSLVRTISNPHGHLQARKRQVCPNWGHVKFVGRMTGPQRGVKALSLCGDIVISGDMLGGLQVWSIDSWKKILEKAPGASGHSSAIQCMRVSHDNSFVATACADGSVRLWNADTWESEGDLVPPSLSTSRSVANNGLSGITSAGRSGPNLLFASPRQGFPSTSISPLGLQPLSKRRRVDSSQNLQSDFQPEAVHCLLIMADNTHIIAGRENGSLSVWTRTEFDSNVFDDDVNNSKDSPAVGSPFQSLPSPVIRPLSPSRLGKSPITEEPTPRTFYHPAWSVSSPDVRETSAITALCYTKNNFIASATRSGEIAVWDITSWSKVRRVRSDLPIVSLEHVRNRVVSGCSNGTMQVWTENWTCERVIKGHSASVKLSKCVGGLCVSRCSLGIIKVWNSDRDWECVQKISSDRSSSDICVGGGILCHGGSDGSISIYK